MKKFLAFNCYAYEILEDVMPRLFHQSIDAAKPKGNFEKILNSDVTPTHLEKSHNPMQLVDERIFAIYSTHAFIRPNTPK
jgi:hypothetical protein